MLTQLRNVALVFALTCVLPTTAPAQSGAAAGGKVEQQVLQAEKDRFAAMIKGDKDALTKLLAEDLTYTHTNTLFETKAQFIASVTSGKIDYVSVVPSESDWKVRVYGDIALVNGVGDVNVVDSGKDLKFRIRYTTVHRNSGGQWQLLAWQATRFPQ
jgi:ketosteroid isomerase-like protein